MGENLASVLVAGSIFAAVWGVGRVLARKLRIDRRGRRDLLVWSIGLGAAASTFALWMLASLHLFQPVLLASLTMAAAAWGLWEFLCVAANPPDPQVIEIGPDVAALEPAIEASRHKSFVFALAGICVATALVTAFAPTTARDVLAELNAAKDVVLDQGFVASVSQHHERVWPSGFIAAWYAWALALDGPVAATLLSWAAGLFTALAAALFAEQIVGRGHASLAGVLVLLSPVVQLTMTLPCGHTAAAAYATLALGAWWRWAIEGEDRRWLVLALVFGGYAASAGSTALPLLGAIAVASCVLLARDRLPSKAPGYVRVIGLVGLTVALLWGLTHLGSFTFPAPGAVTTRILSHIGPIFVAMLPILWVCRRLTGLGLLIGISLVAAVLGAALSSCSGWVLTLVPIWATAAVWVWQELERLSKGHCIAARSIIAAIACLHCAKFASEAWTCLPVVTGYETRDAYVLRKCPDYNMPLLASRLIGPDSHLVTDRVPAGYLDCRITTDCGLGAHNKASASTQRLRELRKTGVTHVLVAGDSLPTAEAPGPANETPCGELGNTPAVLREFPLGADRLGRRYRLLILR